MAKSNRGLKHDAAGDKIKEYNSTNNIEFQNNRCNDEHVANIVMWCTNHTKKQFALKIW